MRRQRRPAAAPSTTVSAPRRHSRLRLRVMSAFALGALVVASTLSVATYLLASRYLIQQRERAATRQTFLDARLVREALTGNLGDPASALDLLELSPRSQAVFVRNNRWFATSPAIGPESLPASLQALARFGVTVHQRVEVLGETRLVVGVPLTAVNGTYFEVFSLSDLNSTLTVIANALLAAAGVTTLGAALLGMWATQRVLRPVLDVSAAAARIAGGDLSARLAPQGDPDLNLVAASFNSMASALEQRIERDTRFVSDVSHELRSPLTTLATAAEVLRTRAADLPVRARSALELVVAEIDRFQTVVEELLELSRAEAGADPLRLESVRLGELVRHVTTRFDGAPFAVDIDPSLDREEVLVDKRRLERVLVNLLENAQDHGAGVVGVHAAHRNGVARFEVEDAGPGVSPEYRTVIFERFARGSKAGSRGASGGAGLGLALVAEHVRLHGGAVWVEERVGVPGARFVVELPWRVA